MPRRRRMIRNPVVGDIGIITNWNGPYLLQAVVKVVPNDTSLSNERGARIPDTCLTVRILQITQKGKYCQNVDGEVIAIDPKDLKYPFPDEERLIEAHRES